MENRETAAPERAKIRERGVGYEKIEKIGSRKNDSKARDPQEREPRTLYGQSVYGEGEACGPAPAR